MYANSFCRQKAELQVLIKVTSKADRWKASGKSFTKKLMFYCMFSVIKNVFPTCLQSFLTLSRRMQSSANQSQILRLMSASCLCYIGTQSKLCDVLWLF